MALNLGSASATLTLNASDFINNAKSAGDAIQGLQNETNSVSSNGGFLNWIQANENALTSWGKRMMATGAIITGALAIPLVAGSKAAWNQVGAVEQATLALRAYEADASKVDAVLSGLLDYARSDMGVLFSREELFAAAQSMKIFGAETDNLVGYTEILSRSVGLGLSDWDSLNTVIGRVGATGRLTGNDFDMLTQRGYELDESLRNTDITWEELFVALDKGMPADALAGQADTIRGKTIRLQSALRNLGLEFLGVDKDTSKFIEGGLGDTLMKGLQQATDLLKRAAPAARVFGNALASAARMASRFVDFIIGLPQPIQTAILVVAGITGAVLTAAGAFLTFLPVIASFVTAFGTLGGLSGILGGLGTAATAALGPVRLLGAGVMAIFANPILLAGAVAIGAAILAYKTNFMGFGDMVRDALGWVQDLWAALQLVFGQTHQTTGNFDIVTTADNVWDQWQLQADGTWKNATLGITSTADDGTLKYMGLDEETGKWMVVHISKTGDEIPGEILSSSQSESDPTKFFMEIQLEGGEKITAVYDEVTGTYQILEDPAQMIIETDEAEQNLSNVEKAAGRVETMAQNIEGSWQFFNAAIVTTISLAEELLGWLKNIEKVAGVVAGALEWALGPRAEDEDGDGRVSMGEQYGNDDPDPNSPLAPSLTNAEGRSNHKQSGAVDSSVFNAGNLGGLLSSIEWITKNTTPAVNEVGNLNSAIRALSPTSNQAAIDNNLMASSVLPVGVNTQATSGMVSAAGASMGASFAGIAASASTNFTAAQSAATTNMGALAANAITQASAAQSNVTSQFSTMSANAAGKFLGMQAQAGVQLALMAGQATTQGNAVNSNLTKGVTAATDSARSVLARLSGIVAGAGANAAWSALSAGANIGNSFASGMESALGRIRAAASAMVAAADAAVIARARIASPSKMAQYWADMIAGRGFVDRILSYVPKARDAMADLVAPPSLRGFNVPSPAFNAPLHGGGYGGGGGSTVIYDTKIVPVSLEQDAFNDLLGKIESAPETAIDLLLTAQSMTGRGN